MSDARDVPDRQDARLEVLADAIRHMPTPAFVTDAGGASGRPQIILANDAVVALTGYSFEQMEGQSPIMFARETVDEAKRARILEAFREGRPFESETVQRRPDGALYHVNWSMSPVSGETGAPDYFFWLQRDVSRQVEAERMRATLFEALNLAEDSVMISSDVAVEFVNRGFLALSGLEESEVVGRPLEALDAVAVDWRTLEPLDEIETGATRLLMRATGRRESPLYLDVATTAVPDPTTGERRLVHVGKDVTEEILRRSEEHAKAYRDILTGLFNRRGGESVLEAARGEAQANGGAFSVVMCDLDRFKAVNDTFGHGVGDLVLQEIGGLLADNVRAGDSAVRWGGEEFLLVLPGASLEVAFGLAERVRGLIGGHRMEQVGEVTMSLGVAEWYPGEGLASVVSRADRALYVSKTSGRNCTSRAEAPQATG